MENNMKELNMEDLEKTVGGVNRVPCQKALKNFILALIVLRTSSVTA